MIHNISRFIAALAIILLTATTAWADSTFSGGDGSQGNPYKIANETDLRQLATDVNGGNSYSGKFFQQSQNITLTQNFTSIGCSKSNSEGGSKSFSGTYDGGNKTIYGLTINGSTNEQGLFGQVENATIQNLTLSGASVTNSASYVGAFVGWSNGGLTMTNCHAVNCEVTASNDKNSVAIFVGYLTNSASTIKSCTVSGGSVSGNKNVGAIVGYAYGSSNDHAIVGCVARGVTGGDNLIGTNTYSCVSNVASYGNNDYTITAGTGVTITYSAVSNTYSDIIHPPYIKAGETVPVTLSYTGSLSNVTYRATGATLNDEGTQLSNAQGNVTITATEAPRTDISGGSIADIAWQTWTGSALTPALTVTVGGKTLTAGTDYLVNYTDNTHIGTATATVTGTGAYKGTLTKTFEIRHSDMPYNSTGNFYEIGNETALRALSSYVGSGGETSGRTFKQTEDITLTSSFSPIGISNYYQFHGIYDGNNKTISGLSVSGNVEYAALFGYMQWGTVKNVILISPSVSSSYKLTISNAGACVSALVGSMNADAIIDNCIVINPTLSATGQGNNYVGIFIGESGTRCSISNCYYYDGNTEHNYAAYEYDNYISATNILRVYSVNATGCTATATPTISVGGTDYYKEGTAVTLSLSGGTAPDGYLFSGYTANGTAIDGNTFTIGSEDAAIAATFTPDPAHFSQSGDTYTINTATGWNVFCDLLAESDKGIFTGKTVNLAADITVTRMAGGEYHDFTGTFDGGGHTLTFSHTATDNYCAPFRHVQGASAQTPAVIHNLNVVSTVTAADYRHPAGLIALQSGHVSVTDCSVEAHISSTKGTANPTDLYPAALVSQSNNTGVLTVSGCTTSGEIATDGKYAAGLIGIVQNTASIENCRVSVTIQSTTSGDGTHGGLVASQASKTTITITGCLFDGSLLGSATSSCGGFIGWRAATATIYNSLFAPAEVTVQNASSATFARNTVDTYNCYYTRLFNDGSNHVPALADGTVSPAKWHNGKATRTVAAAADVTIDAIALTGTATQYTVSGITAYSGGGLQRGETLYYGSGDQLSLTLSNTATGAPQGYQYGYTASAGTLSGSTLTMPDGDVTISVNTAALAPIDWATVNQGDSEEDPYMIYNKDQLLLLAHRVNGTNGETVNTYQGKFFKLGADITFTHPDNEGNNYAENYEAIGHYDGIHEFKGNFDGDGHTVSGIRINKTGSEDANNSQGLFGLIASGAEIHDVHLTDARITGYDYVGGIVAYNFGTVSGCTVTDSYITYNAFDHGTICGRNAGTLTNNYYHGCTVNGTAVTSGVGYYGCDITDNNGALPAYRLALGANITTPPGTFVGQTEWLDTPPVSARLAPENGFTLAGNHYFASGYEFTPGSTLASGAAQGYTPRATLGGQLLNPYTPTGNADPLAGKAIARLSITADCDGKTLNATLISTRQPVTVAFIKADGTTGEASAIALDGHETRTSEYGNQYVDLAAGWYYVGTDIDYTGIKLRPQGNITLILADGCTMHIGTAENRTGVTGIVCLTCDLTIYGQSLDAATAGTISYEGTGSNGFNVRNYTQQSGNVSISNSPSTGGRGIEAGSVTLNGGKLSVATNSKYAIAICTSDGDITINGGQLDATATGSGDIYGLYADGTNCNITLGWTRPDDRITASSYYATRTVAVATGQALTDGSGNIYTGTLTASVLSGFAAKTTLQPALQLADKADNATQIATLNGIETAAILAGRTLYKDGSWNTLCLPFAVDLTASGTLSGDNVQAMTLNTTTSNLADGTLTLNFTAATTIPAGTPFIIKWDKPADYVAYNGQNAATCSDLVSPVFMGVTIDAEKHDATVADVLTFTGTYAPVSIASADGDNTKLYLGAANKLYYPTKAMTIGTHRAYFQLADGITAGKPVSSSNSKQIRAFNLNFGDDEATGIISVHDSGFTVNGSDAWYTLDGRRLDGQPTAKGLYIHGGKKVAIK